MMDEEVGDCLTYLASTDLDHAKAKAFVKFLEQKRKTVKATGTLAASGTVAEREARAYTRPEYVEILNQYREAVFDFQLLDNKRRGAELSIDVWRSMNAAHRKPLVT